MQYFRFLPDPAKLRKEARWLGAFSDPDLKEELTPLPQRLGTGRFGSSSSPDLPVSGAFLETQPRLVVAMVSRAL
jgi:hypothetical protein